MYLLINTDGKSELTPVGIFPGPKAARYRVHAVARTTAQPIVPSPLGGVYATLDAKQQQEWDGGEAATDNRLSWAEDAVTEPAYLGATWNPLQAAEQGVYESVDEARSPDQYIDPVLQTAAQGEVFY